MIQVGAKHQKLPKGYSFEAVTVEQLYPKTIEQQGSDNCSDRTAPMPSGHQPGWESRGVKRKAEYAERAEHWRSGREGVLSEEEKAEKKRQKKEELKAELEELARLKVLVDLREQKLRRENEQKIRMGQVVGDEASRDAWPQNGGPQSRRPMHPPPPQLSRQASDGKEKRTPKANTLYSGSDFVSAHTGPDHLAAPAPSKGGMNSKGAMNGKGGKRGLEGADDTRQKLSKAQQKRREAIWRKIGITVHKKLIADPINSWYFAEPVDPVACQAPTYFDVIKNPMDLGTIGKNLKGKKYETFDQYVSDVVLTFRNAMTFNPAVHNVHKAAAFLLRKFQTEWWPPIQRDIDNDKAQTQAEAQDMRDVEWQAPKKQAPKTSAPVSKKAPSKSGPVKQAGAVYNQASHRAPPPKAPTQPMSMEEKRDLSIALSDMGAELLSGIVDIIKERHADLMSNDEELELDIDALDDITLWKLKAYVAEKAGEEAQSRPQLPQEGDGSTNHELDAPGNSDELGSKDKKAKRQKPPKGVRPSGSSSSSSDNSDSSDNDSSSGSESDADETNQKKPAGSGDRRTGPPGSSAAHGEGPKQGAGGSGLTGASQPDGSGQLSVAPPVPEAIPDIEMTEEQREKHRRALELRAKYTDTIIQARTSDLGPKAPSARTAEEVRRAAEERKKREQAEAARIRAEAEAARAAERRAREEAAAADRRKIEALREAERIKLQQFNKGVELDSHDIEKEYQKIKTLSPQDESRSRSPHLSPPGSASPEADGDGDGNLMEQLGLVMRHDDDEATDDEYDDEVNGGEEDSEADAPKEEGEVEEGEI